MSTRKSTSPEVRLARLSAQSPDSDCILWTGYLTAQGYGRLFFEGRAEYAHRAAFLLAGREIPQGWTIDHLCQVRHCVNPKHLETVTLAENIRRSGSPSSIAARSAVCQRGHDLTPENVYMRSSGKRICRECARLRDRRRYARSKAAA